MKGWDKLQADWKQSKDEWNKLSRVKRTNIIIFAALTLFIGLFIVAYFILMYVPLAKDFISSLKVMVNDPLILFDLKQFLAYEMMMGFATFLLFFFGIMYFVFIFYVDGRDTMVELKKLRKEVQELKDKVTVTEQ
jgi:hypothetical protein